MATGTKTWVDEHRELWDETLRFRAMSPEEQARHVKICELEIKMDSQAEKLKAMRETITRMQEMHLAATHDLVMQRMQLEELKSKN